MLDRLAQTAVPQVGVGQCGVRVGDHHHFLWVVRDDALQQCSSGLDFTRLVRRGERVVSSQSSERYQPSSDIGWNRSSLAWASVPKRPLSEARLTFAAGTSENSAMTSLVRQLPFSLDPLIAEAKRR